MSPSAKRNTAVSETSNNQFNHDAHISHVIAPEQTTSFGGFPEHREPAPKEKNNSRRNKLIAVGAGAMLFAGIGMGVGIGLSSNGEKPPQAVESSAPAEPAPEVTPSTEPTPDTDGETITNNSEFTGVILEQTLTIEEMDAITDIGDFAKLPYGDRLAFALDKKPNMGVASPDNDIGYNDPSAIPAYIWQTLEMSSMNGADTFEGAKIISGKDYYTTDLRTGEIDTEYQQVADSVIQTGGEGKSSSRVIVYEDSGEWQKGFDREGNPIDFINITAYSGDAASGERIGGDMTFQTIRQEVRLLTGETVVYYPVAYSINGKISPDDGYDY